jgi:uncharacterized protein YbaP (TraB family)
VTDSEIVLAQNAGGLLERGKNYVNALFQGQKLSPEQRKDIAKAAILIQDVFDNETKQKLTSLQNTVATQQLDPNQVFGEHLQLLQTGSSIDPSLRKRFGIADSGVANLESINRKYKAGEQLDPTELEVLRSSLPAEVIQSFAQAGVNVKDPEAFAEAVNAIQARKRQVAQGKQKPKRGQR